MSEETKRINVIFPADLLEELDALVPTRKRSEVIIRATSEYVQKLKTLVALKESAGAWSDTAHPKMATPEEITRWVADLRASWRSEPLLPAEPDHA
ncbi:MAG: hypothetical protein RBT47_10400 [Anaerolineae bacterium]|jgi:metal-responsive CopG/Arc/MetJ family transcriptional regulator|nr:hypothetical protein [Anaerolineae bacterium]